MPRTDKPSTTQLSPQCIHAQASYSTNDTLFEHDPHVVDKAGNTTRLNSHTLLLPASSMRAET